MKERGQRKFTLFFQWNSTENSIKELIQLKVFKNRHHSLIACVTLVIMLNYNTFFSERLSQLFNKLWMLDGPNRLQPFHDVSYSIQANTTQGSSVDVAPEPFFEMVNKRFFKRSTYKG